MAVTGGWTAADQFEAEVVSDNDAAPPAAQDEGRHSVHVEAGWYAAPL